MLCMLHKAGLALEEALCQLGYVLHGKRWVRPEAWYCPLALAAA